MDALSAAPTCAKGKQLPMVLGQHEMANDRKDVLRCSFPYPTGKGRKLLNSGNELPGYFKCKA